MIYWYIFLAFFIPNIVGYGGGPSTIPLIQHEVVNRYGWMTMEEFGEILALGNALPGPIATKLAGYIGFIEGGFIGAVVGVFATVAPSLLLMIFLLSLLYKFKESPQVKRMTLLIRPAIAVLLGVMAYEFFVSSFYTIGWVQFIFIAGVSYYLLEKRNVHPAIVIAAALVYGGLFIRI